MSRCLFFRDGRKEGWSESGWFRKKSLWFRFECREILIDLSAEGFAGNDAEGIPAPDSAALLRGEDGAATRNETKKDK